MARFSIPQAVLNSNITMRKARGQKMNTDFGGVPVFRMAWDTLGMDKIVTSSGILRQGIPAEKLTFAAVFKCVSGSSSNASFENSSSDPAFAKVCGLDHIDQVTLSRFMNDDRYDWTDLLAHTVQALSSYPAFVPKSSGYLVIDDTILDKSGKKMDKVKKLKDSSTNRYVIGYNLVISYMQSRVATTQLGLSTEYSRMESPRSPNSRLVSSERLSAKDFARWLSLTLLTFAKRSQLS